MKVKSLLLLAVFILVQGCSKSPETEGAPPQMRRLTEDQYRNTIHDIFGQDIKVVGRFEPEVRVDGLLAVGSSEVSITTAGYEQYFAMAKHIASQALSPEHRDRFVGCELKSNADIESCASLFVKTMGKAIFRRPLTERESREWVQQAVAIARDSNDPYKGLEYVLSGMLIAPEFLFIVDNIEMDSEGKPRLTAYSKASRLSYALWNTSPDQALFDAADAGSLHNKEELEKQVNRMIGDERISQGVAALFSDFLQLDRFNTLEKDKVIYPAFNETVALAAKQQIIKLVTEHLVKNQESYLDLYTTRDTWMNRNLGVVYAVPVVSPEGWEKFQFPEGDPRSGLLSHVGFTALHSHPGRSSATLRGIAIRELILCQPIAAAPAAVNFTVVQDTENPEFKTARDRLTQHRTDDACASCHKIIDPIGLALENFDGAGQFRKKENGVMIDTSGELDGLAFKGVNDLGDVIKKHPATSACLAEKATKYALGRSLTPSEIPWVENIEASFSDNGFNVLALLREVVTSDAFYKVKLPKQDSQAADNADRSDAKLAGMSQ